MYLSSITPYVDLFLSGIKMTVIVSIISLAFSVALALFAYGAVASHNVWLRSVAKIYVEIVRNVPMLVMLYLVYYGLGYQGIHFSPFWAAVVAMSITNGGYFAEIFRAGFDAVPAELHEAGAALGLSKLQIFRHVTFVPGVRNILPAASNQFVILMLFSSIASAVALPELTYQLQRINSITLQTFVVFGVGAAIYYALTLIIGLGTNLLARRMYRW